MWRSLFRINWKYRILKICKKEGLIIKYKKFYNKTNYIKIIPWIKSHKTNLTSLYIMNHQCELLDNNI